MIKEIISDEENVRIDAFLAEKIGDISRSYIKKLINDGHIKVNEKTIKSSYKISKDDSISVCIPEPKELEILAENISIDVVYEDNDIIIVNKEKGMVVHPSAGHYSGTLVNALMFRFKENLSSINGVIRPGIVHRIDMNTSGILVIAKNDKSHESLAKMFKDHSINRTYFAITHGIIKDETGKISLPIGRHKIDRKKMSVNDINGKEAVTNFRVIKRYKNYTFLRLNLETGRTHQIRVHLSHIGFPLLGDDVYGRKNNEFNITGQVLHAKTLEFHHPVKNNFVSFESDLPTYFQNILKILDNREFMN